MVLLCIAPSRRRPCWRRVLPASMDRVDVESVHAARNWLATQGEGASIGAMIDVPNETGAVVKQLEVLRGAAPLLPVLAVLEAPNSMAINRLHVLRCEVMCGIPAPEQVRAFVERSARVGRLSVSDVDDWIRQMVARQELRSADLSLMPVVFGEETLEHARRRLDLTPAQMARRMRALCRRCGARTPVGAHRNLMRAALLHARPIRPRATPRGWMTAV